MRISLSILSLLLPLIGFCQNEIGCTYSQMIKALISILLSLISGVSSAQIIYDLPETVDKKIEERISKNPDGKYVIIFSERDSSRYGISISDDFSKVESFKLIQETLVEKTNRFVKIGNNMIPLITWNDIYFADYGTVYYPDAKSEKRRVGKRKVHFTSDAPVIEFDASGRIY